MKDLMKGGQYTIDITHLPTKKRFCSNVEACSNKDARRYSRYVVDEIRYSNCLWDGKMKISVRKSPFNLYEINFLFRVESSL